MATFLFKTEPSEYAFADLVMEKKTVWTGVSNAAALIALRAVRKGDEVLIYHTGDERAIVGLARAARNAYADPDQPGVNDRGEPRHAVVDLIPIRGAASPATLAQIKADPRFADFQLVTQSRLSVMLIPPDLDPILRRLAGL